MRRRPPRRRRAVPAHLHRRGVRLDRGRLVHRDRSARRRGRRTRRRRPAPTSSRCRTTTTYGLPVVVTRSSNNFGPYQFPEKVIPLFVTNLLEGKKVPLYGDGLNVRDWCYVERQLPRRRPRAAQRERRRDLQHRRRQRGHEPRRSPTRILAHPRPRRVDDRVRRGPSRPRPALLDRHRRRCEALGWGPEREFAEALEATVAWYRDNPWWWEPLKPGN